jgi:hypothetical protein
MYHSVYKKYSHMYHSVYKKTYKNQKKHNFEHCKTIMFTSSKSGFRMTSRSFYWQLSIGECAFWIRTQQVMTVPATVPTSRATAGTPYIPASGDGFNCSNIVI